MKPISRKDVLKTLGRRKAHAQRALLVGKLYAQRASAADQRAEAARLHEIAERVAAIQPPDGPIIVRSKSDGRGFTREGCNYINSLILAGLRIDDIAARIGVATDHLLGMALVFNVYGPMLESGHESGWVERSNADMPPPFHNTDFPDGHGGTTSHASP